MPNLVHELVIATGVVSLTVVIHLFGLDLLQDITRWHIDRFAGRLRLDRVIIPLGIVLGLFVLHGVEIWLYAVLYWQMDMLETLEQALYFSISAYSTVGETGAILPIEWRIVGVLEAINGMILIGWSTAFLFQVLSHLTWEDDDTHPLPKGAIARSTLKGQKDD